MEEPKTFQDVFTTVKNHLLNQKKKCTRVEGEPGCRYRVSEDDGGFKTNPDGSVFACAIGVLIPDEIYDSGIENQPVEIVIDDDYPAITDFFSIITDQPDGLSFLEDLQAVHDLNEPDKWENELRAIAEDYELEF